MRVNQEYRKGGYFWLPNTPDEKVPGTLHISNGGDIKLEIIGLLDNSIEALNGMDSFDRVIGLIEDDGYVTLDNCFYKTKTMSFGGGVAKSIVIANKVLSGVSYDEEEKLTFNTFSFKVDGLDEWLGMSGITVVYSNDYKSAEIKYTPQKELIYQLDNGLKLHVVFSYTLPMANKHTSEVKVKQKAYFKLVSEPEIELSEFITCAHKIINFMSFAVDTTVAISDISATSNSITREGCKEGDKRPVPVKVYYGTVLFSKEPPEINIRKMLFTHEQIKDNANTIINNWLVSYDTIGPSLGLYFSAKSGAHTYTEGKFLALAQTLETYHRRTTDEKLMDETYFRNLVAKIICKSPKDERKWLMGRLLHGNEINLGKRIKMIIEPFKKHVGNSKERSKLIRNIVDARNYLTHYNEKLEASYEKIRLWELCQRMEVIFQLHLLNKVGFSVAEIDSIFENNDNLQQKIKII